MKGHKIDRWAYYFLPPFPFVRAFLDDVGVAADGAGDPAGEPAREEDGESKPARQVTRERE